MDAPTKFERFLVGQAFVNAHTDILDGVGITAVTVMVFQVSFQVDTDTDARKVAAALGLDFDEGEVRGEYLNLTAPAALGPWAWPFRLDVKVAGRVTGGAR